MNYVSDAKIVELEGGERIVVAASLNPQPDEPPLQMIVRNHQAEVVLELWPEDVDALISALVAMKGAVA